MQKRVVLIAGIGTSPAVLTETVWALAHRTKPVVPDEVVVVTTSTGKARVRTELLDGGVWAEMKAALVRAHVKGADRLRLGETSIRVLPDAEGDEIDDLRSADDNLRAADFMLGVVRQYTEDPGTVVYASIAGGRKTMSALLLSCMSLLGRDEDEVLHVLTSPDALSLKPAFHFPRRGATHAYMEAGKERKISSEKVVVELFEVPFVPIRGWFQEKYRDLPPAYSDLVGRMRAGAPRAVVYPEIELDFDGPGSARVLPARRDAKLSPLEFAALCIVASGAPKDAWAGLMLKVKALAGRLDFPVRVSWNDTVSESSRFSAEEDARGDLADCLSGIRRKLRRAGLLEADALAPLRSAAVTYPLSNIRMLHAELLPADIREYLLPKPSGE